MAGMDETVRTALSPIERTGSSGQGADFEAFFRDEHERLFRALWLLTRDRQEAEEVMQDAFLRVWERWGRVSVQPDPVGYLYRTAMNVWRSRLRRAAVAARKTVHPERRADEMAEVEERDVAVRALAGLPMRQRAAVVLMDVLDLSSERAGAVLGIRPVTVRVLAARGRAALASEMGEGDG
jgi:RNA polymerase sigma-70 factor (ECF subfamily)